MKQFVVAAMATVVSCGLALAQGTPKQTPENAQLFLKTVGERHGLGVKFKIGNDYNIGNWSGWWNREREVKGTYWMKPFAVTSVESDRCVTTFKWNKVWNGEQLMGRWEYARQGTEGLLIREWDDLRDRTELVVDWSKLPGVRKDNNSQDIELVGLGKVVVPTNELATRVHYAMEFLRNACDPTAKTGF